MSGVGTPCTACGERGSDVVNSRPGAAGTVRRRRVCKKCGNRYTTVEMTIDTWETIAAVNPGRLDDVAIEMASFANLIRQVRKNG